MAEKSEWNRCHRVPSWSCDLNVRGIWRGEDAAVDANSAL